MTNPFYVASGTPATSSFGASQPMRSEFQAIQGGFEKFPDFTGSAPGTFLINNFTATGITTAPDMFITPAGNIGLGTSTPNFAIDIVQSIDGSVTVGATNTNTGVNATASLRVGRGGGIYSALYHLGVNVAPNGVQQPDYGFLVSFGNGLSLSSGGGPMLFASGTGAERMRIDANGTFTVHGISNFDTTVFQKGIVDVAGPLTVGTATSGAIFLRSNGGAGGITGTIIASGAATYLESILGPLVFLAGGGTVGSPGSATQRMIINNSSGDVTINGGMLEFANGVGGSKVGRIGPNWISNAYGGLSFYYLSNSSFVEGMRLDYAANVGIGTSTITNMGGNIRVLDIQGSSPSRGGGITLKTSDSSLFAQFYAADGAAYAGSGSSHPFLLTTGSLERMRIAANGNVGIGVAPTTGAILDIGRDQAAGTFAKITNNNSSGYGSWNISNDIGSSGGFHFFGSAYATSASTKADGALFFSTGAGGLSLNTYANGTSIYMFTASTERMRIDQFGNVSVLTGGMQCTYGFSTFNNQTPVASNTLVNSGLGFSTGAWLVHAYIYGVGTAQYSAVAIVVCDGLDARAALINQGGLLSISVSGLGLYGQQNSGVSQTIYWLVTKFYG